jgi:hypothetical protein
MSKPGLLLKSVKLASGEISPGDAVLVQADGYRNSLGTFRGVMRDGRLARCGVKETNF